MEKQEHQRVAGDPRLYANGQAVQVKLAPAQVAAKRLTARRYTLVTLVALMTFGMWAGLHHPNWWQFIVGFLVAEVGASAVVRLTRWATGLPKQ